MTFDIQKNNVIITVGVLGSEDLIEYITSRQTFLIDYGIDIPSNIINVCIQPDKNIYSKRMFGGVSIVDVNDTFIALILSQFSIIETRTIELNNREAV